MEYVGENSAPSDPPVNAALLGANMQLAQNKAYAKARARKQRALDMLRAGMGPSQIVKELGVAMTTYESWRARDPDFRRIATSIAKALKEDKKAVRTEEVKFTHAEFAARFFGMDYAQFQIDVLDEIDRTPLGNMLMVQFPPEHGKTTMFENYANEQLAVNPNWRNITVSEAQPIARKIISRVKNRMEPFGPTPGYVARYGPFTPQVGEGRKPAQAWGADAFSVYKKATHDERDYSMAALGAGSGIVSARADHLHLDDIQAHKSLPKSQWLMDWFRKDAVTRPGKSGITTIFGTKVGDADFYEMLEDDADLDGILKVIRLPAIVEDHLTGEMRPLWAEYFTLEELDKLRRVVGPDVWDLSYMMHRTTDHGNRSFKDGSINLCLNPSLSVQTPIAPGTVCYATLDPALDGRTCVMLLEVKVIAATDKEPIRTRLVVRRIWEVTKLQANHEVIGELAKALLYAKECGAIVTDVIIETKNFQKALINEESLIELRAAYGFNVRQHDTGLNKYDETIGVTSLATSFAKGEIELPWAEDNQTRFWIGELIRQLKAWRPLLRGNKHRQDMVMALWFGWILWRQRHKQSDATMKRDGWRAQGVPWKPTRTGLLVPSVR